jgi:precorrin-6A/cobalt-precorrin-6A reductase
VSRRVLVLGGTAEARQLAAELAARPGYAVTSSLAGRVAEPARPAGELRVGRFGGVDGLVDWLRAHRIDVLVDATHPFAARMSRHAAAAAARLELPLLALRRPGWTAGPGDRWHRVPDAVAAARLLPGLGERVFLATGRGDLDVFARLDLWFLLRAVDPPPPPLPARRAVVLDRGPFSVDAERALLNRHRIEVLVARDSGGTGAAAKLQAARELALPVVLIDRPPPPPDVPTAATVPAALSWLTACRTPLEHRAGGPDGAS